MLHRSRLATGLALAACLLALLPASARAQELRATVTVNAPNLTIIDRKVMDEFETVVREFLNQTQFTDYTYEDTERIECNFTFTVQSERDERIFETDLLVQSSRPVYGTDYVTTVLNYADGRGIIEYEQYQPLIYSRDAFTSSLVSLLAFHAHVVIAADRDTFEPFGGETTLRQAENILVQVSPAAQSLDRDWTSTGGQRSRFRLMQEWLNPRARLFRQALYDYHRRGLDLMGTDAIAGRTTMARSLTSLERVRTNIPNSLLLSIFSAAKTQELVEVFSASPPPERASVYQVMTAIDPANINRLRAIR